MGDFETWAMGPIHMARPPGLVGFELRLDLNPSAGHSDRPLRLRVSGYEGIQEGGESWDLGRGGARTPPMSAPSDYLVYYSCSRINPEKPDISLIDRATAMENGLKMHFGPL
jgi:hypothetical protein